MRARYWDPAGERYGIPTYPRRLVPAHLLTLQQLAAAGLRPGGQGVQAQVVWPSRRHGAPRARATYLYDVRLALPKRTATPHLRAALREANASRRTCPECLTEVGYVLPRHLGTCLDCAQEGYAEEVAA